MSYVTVNVDVDVDVDDVLENTPTKILIEEINSRDDNIPLMRDPEKRATFDDVAMFLRKYNQCGLASRIDQIKEELGV